MSGPATWAPLGLVLAIAVIVLCSWAPRASAAVTSSSVTTPGNPSFYQLNEGNPGDPAHQITMSGTTSNDGIPGNVDLVCTYGQFGGTTAAATLADDVTVNSDGSFTWSGPPVNSNHPCVLRAVPTGTDLPTNLAPFTGPTVGLGELNTSTLSSGQVYDFHDDAAQLAGDADYNSVGNGGLFDAYPADPSTLVLGQDMFFSNDYLSDNNTDRSDIEVDGTPAYAPATAETLVSGSGADFTGLPAVTFASTQDPQTGDVTIAETDPLVQCEPDPATYPPTATSCTSFASAGISLTRTIAQNQSGRQATISDNYTSTDGAAHTLDLRYGQDFQQTNAGFDFPWVDGPKYNTHSVGDIVPAPPAAPATMYVDWDRGLSDGAENSAQGAISFGSEPSGFQFASNGVFGQTHFYVSYSRTVPASGTVNITTTYSWAFSIADVQALAAIATGAPPVEVPPATTTGSVSALTNKGATISGWVNPNGETTKYHFEYGTTPSYGSVTPAISAGDGSSTDLVSAALTGLTPGVKYYYRLVATNPSGTGDGSQGTFYTTAPPAAITGSASSITATGATIAASVTANGLDTTYHFEYGTTPTSYGNVTTSTDDGSGTTSGTVTASLTGLTAEKQYYYRVVATNSVGTTDGLQGTFTTFEPPAASTGAASAVTDTTATLAGSVNPNGHDTSYHFEYGTTPGYGNSSTATDDGSGTTTGPATADLTGLAPGTTYYYRLVATSVAATTDGTQGTFTTTQPPTASTGGAPAITTTTATITGSVNPNGLDTSYHFEYGTTPGYGNSTAVTDDGSGTASGPVSAHLAGLTPGTKYYYRLVATSVAGTTDGAPASLTTATPAPPPKSPPPKSPPPKSPPKSPGSAVSVRVNHTAVTSAGTATVDLGCSGASGSHCSGSLVLQASIKHHGHKALAPVGGAGYSMAAGSQTTVQVRLNGAGRAALAHTHTLRVTLVVKLGTSPVATRTLVFKSHKHKH